MRNHLPDKCNHKIALWSWDYIYTSHEIIYYSAGIGRHQAAFVQVLFVQIQTEQWFQESVVLKAWPGGDSSPSENHFSGGLTSKCFCYLLRTLTLNICINSRFFFSPVLQSLTIYSMILPLSIASMIDNPFPPPIRKCCPLPCKLWCYRKLDFPYPLVQSILSSWDDLVTTMALNNTHRSDS